MSRSEICEDSLVLAAVCCWTRTSAASAKCISVFLSGLSSKFLQPMHLQMDEHMIFACRRANRNIRPVDERRTTDGSCTQENHLVALAVVLQAARSLAVAAFAVPPVRLPLFAFTDFRFEGLWIPVQTRLGRNVYTFTGPCDTKQPSNNQTPPTGPALYLYGFEALGFVLQVVEAVVAVAVIAELPVCKAVAVSGGRKAVS